MGKNQEQQLAQMRAKLGTPVPKPAEKVAPEPASPVVPKTAEVVASGTRSTKPGRSTIKEGVMMSTEEPLYQGLYWRCVCCKTDWINIQTRTCPTTDCPGIAPQPRTR